MKKYISLTLALITASVASATGLSFQTLAPTVGDILTSSSGSITSGTAQFGTLSGNLNLAGTAGFTEYSEFSSIFNLNVASAFTGAGEVTASIGTGTLAAGVNLWMLVDLGGEQGAFFLGTTPELGGLVSNPSLSSASTVGSKVGNNLLLASAAVPEPSSFALLAGCFGMAWVMVRRRS